MTRKSDDMIFELDFPVNVYLFTKQLY